MRFKPKKSDGTKERTLANMKRPADGHPYMGHHSLYASNTLRKKRAKRQQQELRRGELRNAGNMGKEYQTASSKLGEQSDREFSTDVV